MNGPTGRHVEIPDDVVLRLKALAMTAERLLPSDPDAALTASFEAVDGTCREVYAVAGLPGGIVAAAGRPLRELLGAMVSERWMSDHVQQHVRVVQALAKAPARPGLGNDERVANAQPAVRAMGVVMDWFESEVLSEPADATKGPQPELASGPAPVPERVAAKPATPDASNRPEPASMPAVEWARAPEPKDAGAEAPPRTDWPRPVAPGPVFATPADDSSLPDAHSTSHSKLLGPVVVITTLLLVGVGGFFLRELWSLFAG